MYKQFLTEYPSSLSVGRPPKRPLLRETSCLIGVLASPPFLPIKDAALNKSSCSIIFSFSVIINPNAWVVKFVEALGTVCVINISKAFRLFYHLFSTVYRQYMLEMTKISIYTGRKVKKYQKQIELYV